jgi:hypothetical protein
MPQFEPPHFENQTRPIAAQQTASGDVLVNVPDVGPVVVQETIGSQNWRTIAFNLGIAIILAILTLMTTIDWTQWVNPTVALFIVTIANAILRTLTAGPVGSNVRVHKVQ